MSAPQPGSPQPGSPQPLPGVRLSVGLDPVVGTPVVVGSGPQAGTPVVVMGRASRLAGLADVDTSEAPVDVALVWRRHVDGVWRPERPAAPVDQPTWSTPMVVSEAPPDPGEAPPGALWLHLGPDMKIYRRTET